MRAYGQRDKQKPVRLFLRRAALAALFLVVIFASLGVWSVYKKERESAQLRQENEQQLADLTNRQAALQKRINELGTDRGKEEILREQYSLGDQGEGMIVIVDPTETSAPSQATSTPFTWLHKTFSWW